MNTDIRCRLGGLLALAVGLGAGWWGILLPLAAARAHSPEVSYSTKVFVFVPLAIVFGLFFVIVGDRVPYRKTEAQNLTAAGWLLLTVAGIASLAGFFLFKQQFAALGYAS